MIAKMLGKILCVMDIMRCDWIDSKVFDYKGTPTEAKLEVTNGYVSKVEFNPDIFGGKYGHEVYQAREDGWITSFSNIDVTDAQASVIEGLVVEHFPDHAEKIVAKKPKKDKEE